ncbi:MAG: hypothetical protein PUE01_03670 [Clostridiaceae bacterium]|nr:hypothetical protein [Clostridiaceae bacterium]
MEKINEYIKNVLDEKVSVYKFDKKVVYDGVPDILDVFELNGVKVKRVSISGYDDEENSLFQVFDNANSIRYFSTDDSSIKKLSILCEINKISFRFIIDYYKQLVGVVSRVQDNLDLESLLLQIEKLGREKTR